MKTVIFILGPTGVGKTALSLELGKKIPIEVINGDTGQFYTPLTIGTAKPAWQTEPIPHHLFDVLATPENYTSVAYRKAVEERIVAIQERGATPVIVGGSFFYSRSLFFRISELPEIRTTSIHAATWDALNALDPVRAAQIHPNDTYRIQRALMLWETTGMLPSHQKPSFDPISDTILVVYCSRTRDELYARINARVHTMIDQGWIDEVTNLPKIWKEFLRTKKIIGYTDIDSHLQNNDSQEKLISSIQQKTRNYAKRQETAWRTFKKDIAPYKNVELLELDLTLSPVHLYIDQLLSNFNE